MAEAKKKRTEFGDFQTPSELAHEVCSLISTNGFAPCSILEPTCGQGSFVMAALEAFPHASIARGFDINLEYIRQAKRDTVGLSDADVQIQEADFFLTDWDEVLSSLPGPLLIVGNPPWVTNAVLGALRSRNLPAKSNVDNLRGIDALMGKSNFDISEWMLRKYIEWLDGRQGLLAVLCKTSVARKVLLAAWNSHISMSVASVYRIDSKKHFDVAVDACALVIRFEPGASSTKCSEFESLDATSPSRIFGMRDDWLVADVNAYAKWSHLATDGLSGWRSGIKHDCSKVFELTRQDGMFVNGLGERLDLEPCTVFPLLKSSDLARDRSPRKWLLVPHKSMQDDVGLLQRRAPRAWQYLEDHADFLKKRGSSIYRKRHPFSIFGVGAYSFAPWKIAISGLYKNLRFVKVSAFDGCPVVLDDTCYSFACQSQEECDLLFEFLSSIPARAFFSAFIFWDTKRPITTEILNRLDLKKLADAIGRNNKAAVLLARRQISQYSKQEGQQIIFT